MGSTIDNLTRTGGHVPLGGFFNLSGLPPDSLAGPHYGIARLLIYRSASGGVALEFSIFPRTWACRSKRAMPGWIDSDISVEICARTAVCSSGWIRR